MNGTAIAPYRAIEEQNTNRRTRLAMAADIIPVVAVTTFRVTKCGLKTLSPSYAVAAQW